jgi:hypothetical protein
MLPFSACFLACCASIRKRSHLAVCGTFGNLLTVPRPACVYRAFAKDANAANGRKRKISATGNTPKLWRRGNGNAKRGNTFVEIGNNKY